MAANSPLPVVKHARRVIEDKSITNTAKSRVEALIASGAFANYSQIAKHLGINPGLIHKLIKNDHLTPSLYGRLMEHGYLEKSPMLAMAPICPVHGVVHARLCSDVSSKRSPRLSIQKNSPRQAAETIVSQLGANYADQLIAELRTAMQSKRPFDVGTSVYWESQSHGKMIIKHGIVIAVLPSGYFPNETEINLDQYLCRFRSNAKPRRSVSYLVLSNGRIYWPLTKNINAG